MTDLVVLGAGGHARVLVAALALRGMRPIGCVAPNAPDGKWPEGVPHLGDDTMIEAHAAEKIELVNGIGSVGTTRARRRIFEVYKAKGYRFAAVVHPAAHIADDVTLGEGVQAMAGAIVQTGAAIGDNVLINSGAVVDHDCRIGAHCHIATGAALSGNVTLGTGVHIGTGAAVIQGITIGDGTIVGAGAVVIRDAGAGETLVGVPAKPAHGAAPGT